jgi:hypothetical protein
MSNAYNHTWLRHLHIIKGAKTWAEHELIAKDQLNAIREQHPVGFYHPNVFIRILLFIAALIGLGGVTGLLALMFGELIDNETAAATMLLLYGIVSFVVLDRLFIANMHHYKTGVTEALLYHAAGFTITGAVWLLDTNSPSLLALICLVVLGFSAFRYLDLISTAGAFIALVYFIFDQLYQAGGLVQQIIPIVLITLFIPAYFLIKKLKKPLAAEPWHDVLLILEALSLLLVYAAGNYLVVRELSSELMGLIVEPGGDIPFAFLFYGLTVIIPAAYLYFGLKQKDLVLIRVSLIAIACSVFTFKFYYSIAPPEIALTLAGAFLLTVALFLFRYLKTPQHGYTRENLLKEKWGNANLESLIVSQTLGGNEAPAAPEHQGGDGGSFAGGGSTDRF